MIYNLIVFLFVLFAPIILANPTPEQIALWNAKLPIKKPAVTPPPIPTPPPIIEPIVIPTASPTPEFIQFQDRMADCSTVGACK